MVAVWRRRSHVRTHINISVCLCRLWVDGQRGRALAARVVGII